MWLKLLKHRTIEQKGTPQRYAPGDWIQVGKQQALSWLAQGIAEIPDFSKIQELVSLDRATIFLLEGASVHDAILDSGITIQETTWARLKLAPVSVIVSDGLKLRAELVPVGINLLKSWEMLVPLHDYDQTAITLADRVGEAKQTAAVVRDLRVPYYNTSIIFVRRNKTTSATLEAWRADDGHAQLAFLRAVYTNKPKLLALPTSWSCNHG